MKAKTQFNVWRLWRLMLWAPALLAWPIRPASADTIINHADLAGATNLASDVIARLSQLRWFFTHASVGGNIVTGVNVLHEGNPGRYPIQIYEYDGNNDDGSYHGAVATEGSEGGPDYRASADPAVATNGLIYECMRGNPDWANKLTCFSNSIVQSKWRFPKVNVAMDKFCWIDPYAEPDVYCAQMNHLEGRFPQTLFVYATMPLTTETEGTENDLRNNFNRYVRSFCGDHGRWLLDVADIEAWTPAGVEQTYGGSNQSMYASYALDAAGGDFHLNLTGRRREALGWYALAGALFTTDRDQDGMSDGNELIAGTCPTNAADYLAAEVNSELNLGGNGIVLQWHSASNRVYSIERATTLSGGPDWTGVVTNLPATPAANTYTAQTSSAVGFFRIRVRQ